MIGLALIAALCLWSGVYGLLQRARITTHERNAQHWHSMYQTALERACDLEIDPLGEQEDPVVSIRHTRKSGSSEEDAIYIRRAQGTSQLFAFDHGAQVWRHPETGHEVFARAAKRCTELHFAAARTGRPSSEWLNYPIT